MIIAKVKNAEYIINGELGEKLMFFTEDGFCDIISIHDVKSLITSGKTIKTKHKYDKEIFQIQLEIGSDIEKLCEFNSLGEIVFFNKDFLASLIDEYNTKYLSVNGFAKKAGISKSTLKRKILEEKVSGVITLYSESNKVSAYAIPENSEVLWYCASLKTGYFS